MAQAIGGRFIFGGRGCNLWRNKQDAVLFSAAEGATFGATNRRQFYIPGGRGRNIWRNQ